MEFEIVKEFKNKTTRASMDITSEGNLVIYLNGLGVVVIAPDGLISTKLKANKEGTPNAGRVDIQYTSGEE